MTFESYSHSEAFLSDLLRFLSGSSGRLTTANPGHADEIRRQSNWDQGERLLAKRRE